MPQPPPHRTERIGRMAAVALLYVVTGRLGLELAHFQENATLFWAPTGLSLAALILYGLRFWPSVLVGSLMLNFSTGLALPVSIGFALGNTLEAVTGAWLLERVARFNPRLERVRDVVALVVIGAMGCTVVSASFGTASLHLFAGLPSAQVGVVWLIWWLGDLGGALVVTPLLLLWVHGRPSWRSLAARREAWLILGLLAVSGALAFGGLSPPTGAILASFVPLLLLVWAGVRLGPRGTMIALIGTVVMACVGAARGHGPFVAETTHASLLLLWAYGTTLGSCALILSAAIAERELAQARVRDEQATRLRMERRMGQAQRLESLGLLAGGVAHDFNNILAIIRGNTALLRKTVAGDPSGEARIDKIELASERAVDLCRSLLAYAGHRRPAKQTLELADLVRDTWALVDGSIGPKIRCSLPSSDASQHVEGDETLLRQVILNLVLNASEAIGDAEGVIAIEIGRRVLDEEGLADRVGSSRAVPGDFGWVAVCDDGSGMDPLTKERIFDPFFSSKVEGRGLGLAAVQGIVFSHDGAIEVTTTPGKGTRVCVYLPVADRACGRNGGEDRDPVG